MEGIEELRESKIRIRDNKVELTKKDYDKLNEDLEITQLQLQEANDTLNGGITNRNMANFRNTYVINASDSLDSSYPMYVYFRVLDETVRIVSVKVSYWIHKYRAYSKAAAAGGGQTTSSGGGQTTSSGGSSTPTTNSGGGQTSSSGGGQTTTTESQNYTIPFVISSLYYVTNVGDVGANGYLPTGYTENRIVAAGSHTHTVANHTHTVANHTHTVNIPNHTHTVANHTHTITNHTHDADYGIFEEDTTPTIKFTVSQDNGITYSNEYANVPINQELINITDNITKTGSKIIKFESTTRARLTIQIEVKVDISVR